MYLGNVMETSLGHTDLPETLQVSDLFDLGCGLEFASVSISLVMLILQTHVPCSQKLA